jgi:hypothetical protein
LTLSLLLRNNNKHQILEEQFLPLKIDGFWHCQFPGCAEISKKLSHIERHIKSMVHLNYREVECDVCHFLFPDVARMNAHKDRQHLNPMVWRCVVETCGERYAHDVSLRSHISNKHRESDLKNYDLKNYSSPSPKNVA